MSNCSVRDSPIQTWPPVAYRFIPCLSCESLVAQPDSDHSLAEFPHNDKNA